ncbi:MAG: helix-turn-helix transcriptional regulator [Bacteroidales bacterium]|nr:helix-turn-helix transcriptional regulator [Bacteroidales bacterium]MCC8119864.1 helix-turn-helix transcriptional regulator [Bacteroidales bacterium]
MPRKPKFTFTQDEGDLRNIGRIVALCCNYCPDEWQRAEHWLSHPADFVLDKFTECLCQIEIGEARERISEYFMDIKQWPKYVGLKNRIACWAGFFEVLDALGISTWYCSSRFVTEINSRMSSAIGISTEGLAKIMGMPPASIFRLFRGSGDVYFTFMAKLAIFMGMPLSYKLEHPDDAECRMMENSYAPKSEIDAKIRSFAEDEMRKIKDKTQKVRSDEISISDYVDARKGIDFEFLELDEDGNA